MMERLIDMFTAHRGWIMCAATLAAHKAILALPAPKADSGAFYVWLFTFLRSEARPPA